MADTKKAQPAAKGKFHQKLAQETEAGFSAWPFTLVYLAPLAVYLGHQGGGWYNYSIIALAFGLIPLLDIIFKEDNRNPTKEQEKRLSFRFVTWAWVPMQVGLQIASCYWYATNQLQTHEVIGLALSTGFLGGLGINCAHELLHKRNAFEKFLAKIALLPTCYMHFMIEHVVGHHSNVATPSDPASSRLGESFYRFLPRTVIGSYRSAWHLELQRLAKAGVSPLSWQNEMIWYTVSPIMLGALLAYVFQCAAVFPFFFAQGFFAASLLEVINYVEHYGLQRKEIEPDLYEIVSPKHSWNAPYRITNYFLFKLQRHSDHHAYPTRRYQILRSFDYSPQLPTGYSGMLMLALVPPLWFYVMDKRVAEINAQKAIQIEEK